ncbi:MAG: hypothetical protein CMJ94_00230 [Planctomycetes bacterium]|nr:hypothetical protein [Planctomycetota bacterium]
MDGESPSAPSGATSSTSPARDQFVHTLHAFARGMLEARTVDDLLWDVAARTIAQLGYEDCVIYLVDPERSCLVQRAAHGRKSPREQVIVNRIELPFGEGIVGAVAQSGRGEIVPDVRKDPRYVVDDEARASEMAVPIVHKGTVLGVLDSEASQIDAFDQEDFEIFETIASMLATRVAAEQVRDEIEYELRRMNRAAEEASRAKGAFLANVSHEVRTPLVAVLGVTEMLQGLVEGGAPREVILDHLGVIHRSGDHLLSLINQLLDLSSAEQGRVRISPRRAEPRALLEEISNLFRNKAAERGLELIVRAEGDIPDSFVTDPTRVRQVMMNLVDNALKFTEQGSVEVTLSPIATAGAVRRQLRLEVRDTGPGVPEDEREHIFESFHQLDAHQSSAQGGLGLGLGIARLIARNLGGDLWVEPSTEPGARFVLHLSEMELPLAKPEGAPVQPSDSGRLRILLAEDNPDSRRLINFHLEEAGHEVVAVADGELALEKVRAAQGDFDAVLLDMRMPKCDGFEVARALRQMNYSQPIIALTAQSLPGDRAKCLEAGCTDYLAKPFNWSELFGLLRSAKSQ